MNEKENNRIKNNNSSNNLNGNNKNPNEENAILFNNKNTKNKIRHSSVFEILGIKAKDKNNYDKISSDLKKYEKEFNINVSYSNRKNIRFEPSIETSKIIEILKLPPEKRTFDNIFSMKKYLLTTKIDNLFKDEFNNKEESIDKMLTFFAFEMKYRLFRTDDVVYRIGDLSVYLFLIIQGKVEILKSITEIRRMSGYEYFCYLLDLKNSCDEYLFNMTIKDNLKVYYFEKSDFDQMPNIYILNLLEKFKIYKNINFEEEFDLVNIDPEDLGLNPEKINSPEYIFLRLKQIRDCLTVSSPDIVNKYKFIIDHNEQKEVKIYKYISFLNLDKNAYFGESVMGDDERRSSTIRVVEDSYLGFLSASSYKTNFFAEKKIVTQNKISFLHSKFFFNKINLKRFAKKYFNLFISDTFVNGNIIFNENDPIEYVYFIEEGIIELSSSKTILEIEIFLKGLENRISLNDETVKMNYKNISSNTDDLQTYLNRTQKNKILIVGNCEIMGLESFYYNIPYFTTARVKSSKAKLFKIDSRQLKQILKIEVDCLPELKYLVLNKTKIIKKRFFGINNTKLTLIDEKINQIYEDEYYKNLKMKRNLEDEINKTQKNNVKTNNESQDKNVLKPKTRRNSSFLNLGLYEAKTSKPKKRKINYFSLFKNNEKNNKNNSLILNDVSSQYQKENNEPMTTIEKIKNNNTYFEDKLLNEVKNQIRILNRNKYFFSRINLPKKNKTFELRVIHHKKYEEEKKKKINFDSDMSNNSKEEKNILINTNTKKSFNSKLFDTQIKNNNESTYSILPSIFSDRGRNKKNLNRSLSFVNNDKNNYSCSLNFYNNKSLYRNSLSPNNQKSKIFTFLSEKNNKNLCDKNFLGLNIKKFNNFYEIKNNYQKEKYKFYNDSELFGFKKKEELKSLDVNKIKDLNNVIKTIKCFSPKIQIKNKEIISKLKFKE